jgi:hypothetical protein
MADLQALYYLHLYYLQRFRPGGLVISIEV